MAKKDKVDGTPIEFYIPPADLGGKGSRVPIPINQPNWKYKYFGNMKSRPGYSEWLVIGIILTIAIAFGVLIITDSMHKSPLWIAVITLVVIAVLQIRSAAIKSANHTQEIENDEVHSPKKRERKKRKKKNPKHRKDYK